MINIIIITSSRLLRLLFDGYLGKKIIIFRNERFYNISFLIFLLFHFYFVIFLTYTFFFINKLPRVTFKRLHENCRINYRV